MQTNYALSYTMNPLALPKTASVNTAIQPAPVVSITENSAVSSAPTTFSGGSMSLTDKEPRMFNSGKELAAHRNADSMPA